MEGRSSTITVVVLNELSVSSSPSSGHDAIDVDRWADLVRRVLETEGVEAPAETNVVFVDELAMAELNAEHMGGNGPTDVLSFPIDDDPSGIVSGDDIRFVGDIVVCPAVAAANAPAHAGSLDDEIALLLVHGSLHLLGHDHAEPGERDLMWAAEQRLLAALWSPLPRDPWAES